MSADTNELSSKIIIAGVLAAIVGGVAALSGVDLVVLLIAVIASLVAFWLLDGLFGRQAHDALVGASRGGGPLPVTATQPLAAPVPNDPANGGLVPPPTPADPPGQRVGARLDPAQLEADSVEIKANSQGKSRAFSVRIAKHGNTIAECEDAVSVDPRRAVLAVADGASSSFGAHLWAAALTQEFVKVPPKPLSVAAFASWLADARARLAAVAADDGNAEGPNGWWSEQGARQGAYSTLVGAAIMTDGDSRVATVMCLGDSSAFVLTGVTGERTVRRSLPYEDASQFGSHPALLGSMSDRPHDEPTWTTIPTAPGDLLVLASDAVAEWLLGDPRRFSLLDVSEPESIAARLVAERTDGLMVNDDLTLAVLELAP